MSTKDTVRNIGSSIEASSKSGPVIRVENLAKQYMIGGEKNPQQTFREMINGIVSAPIKRLRSLSGIGKETSTIWAVNDVSFQIKQGEVVGVIGRNGAGKSTLLKLLSRITAPTAGKIVLKGRIGSLLEVGTGFHPELSGRENIFLNGAILGMSRIEINKKFDEIVEFSEVEKFLDTPVKRYSSGMYVRLAFAVAAHLDPEILLVDEVLAVGDSEFQKKCFKKLGKVANDGRVVIVVSHNMSAIQRLCSSAMVLEHGEISASGDVNDCIQRYLASGGSSALNGVAYKDDLDGVGRRGSGDAIFTQIEIVGQDGQHTNTISYGDAFKIRITILAKRRIQHPTFGFSFIAADGVEIQGSSVNDSVRDVVLNEGENIFECDISPVFLAPSRYYIRGAIFGVAEVFDHLDEILSFEVVNVAGPYLKEPIGHHVGYVFVPYTWRRME